MVICLERGADLHMAQLMPLPLAVSCFSKIQIGFTFLVPAHPGSPGQRAVKRVCVQAVLVAGYCYRHCSLVCLSVLDTAVSSAEVAELIRVLFGLKTCVGPLNRVLDGASVPQSRRGTLQEEVYPTLLWPLASGRLLPVFVPAGCNQQGCHAAAMWADAIITVAVCLFVAILPEARLDGFLSQT